MAGIDHLDIWGGHNPHARNTAAVIVNSWNASFEQTAADKKFFLVPAFVQLRF
ncbi:hypothetical protein RM553_03850 [Zunongwangia sp. F363]|uniref:Uncharacterized protein n=1 Tax=Autumnicola tepida TaxID=3075595 RepID=A0ABU3C6I9_9FLAO|nr:hypothetical protein [Zunongwangia sp. F363]MDT0641958.1 hypothetical protein [Zunongwangia sp. F363]